MVDILDAVQTNSQTPPAATDMPVPPPPPALTDELVVPPPTEENKPPEPKKETMPSDMEKPKKKLSPAAIITGIILLFITLPLAGYAVQHSEDIRSMAKKDTGYAAKIKDNQKAKEAQYQANLAAKANPAGGTPKPATTTAPQNLPDTSTCKGTSGEGAIACQKNPPTSVQETTDPATGIKTRITTGYPTGGDGLALTNEQKYTLITKTDSNNNVVSQTLNGRDLLAINNSYSQTNPNIGKICNRGAVGSNEHGAAVSSCGDGAACVNNLCVVAGQPCIMAANDSPDPCGSGSKCVGALHVEGPKGGVATAPGTCVPQTSCQACAAAGNSASECSAVCGVQTPNMFITPTTPPSSGGGGGTTPKSGGGGNGGTPAPQCVSIVVYDSSGNALGSADLAALHPGDTVTLAYAPGGNATKVRFQITADGTAQGWNESTTKNTNSQFTWSYTLTSATSFSIAAQWFDGTNWNE